MKYFLSLSTNNCISSEFVSLLLKISIIKLINYTGLCIALLGQTIKPARQTHAYL